jgi:hypothetical protein
MRPGPVQLRELQAGVDHFALQQGVCAGRQPVLAVRDPTAHQVAHGAGDDVLGHHVDPCVGRAREDRHLALDDGAEGAGQALHPCDAAGDGVAHHDGRAQDHSWNRGVAHQLLRRGLGGEVGGGSGEAVLFLRGQWVGDEGRTHVVHRRVGPGAEVEHRGGAVEVGAPDGLRRRLPVGGGGGVHDDVHVRCQLFEVRVGQA